ncbi:hypothetical protein FOL47_003427 [Perkinsus chesapeaki]|uniref:Uncharacterized protein n=1 Tax=Perkinsus chesapeaki TaxID=330153 RepID=A0A7J6KPA9_PERCH|nr:hypothetical protein FOL47_003427 [Perkinsus chesapeaki]
MSAETPGQRVGSVLDVSADGYYNSDRCLSDFAQCSRAVSSLSEGKYHCVFLTDRSPIHCKLAEGALNVRVKNVKPGGKQPKMRDGWFWEDGRKHVQKVVFPPNHQEFPGQPKELRQVYRERFGEDAVAGLKHGGLLELLSGCDDFKSQRTLLQDEAEERGDKVIFGVKFHPELAPIEAAYRTAAKALQVATSAGSSAGFKERVIASQNLAELTLSLVRKHFRSAREHLKLYSEDKSLEQIEQHRKVKGKHRGEAPQLGHEGDGPQPGKPGKYERKRL